MVERVLTKQAEETVRIRARITAGASRLRFGDGLVEEKR